MLTLSPENPATEKCEHSEGLSLEYLFFLRADVFFVQGHVKNHISRAFFLRKSWVRYRAV